MDPDEEAAERAGSDEDEFYDRTADGRTRKLRARDAPALDAATLYGRKVRCTLLSPLRTAAGIDGMSHCLSAGADGGVADLS